MRLKRLFGFFIILTLISAIDTFHSNLCYAKDWKEKPFDEDKNYLYFVGRAIDASSYKEGRQSAIQYAVSNLVGYFGTKVVSSFGSKTSVSISSMGEEFEKEAVSQLSSTGKADLEGLIILDDEYEEKKRKIGGQKVIVYDVFVRLRYSKEAMIKEKRRIEKESQKNLMTIHEGMMDGEDYEKKGDVSSAFQAYISAIVTSTNIGRDDLHTEALNSFNGLAQRIQIANIEDDVPGVNPVRDNQPEENALLLSGISNGVKAILRTIDGDDIPIQNLPIIFTKLGGEKPSPVITNKDGIALSNYKTIISAAIDASNFLISPSGISDEDRLAVRKAVELIEGKEVTFKIKRKSLKVLILISEKNLGKEMEDSIVGNAISEKLYEAGFKVMADTDIGKSSAQRLEQAIQGDQLFSLKSDFYRLADVVISGNVKTRKGGDAMGYAIISYADAHIKAISLKTGEVVAGKNFTRVKGFGLDEEESGIKALTNIASQIAEELTKQLLNME